MSAKRSLRSVFFPRCKLCRDRGYVEREVTVRMGDPRWSLMLFGGLGGTQYVIERDVCACQQSGSAETAPPLALCMMCEADRHPGSLMHNERCECPCRQWSFGSLEGIRLGRR